MGKAKKRLLIIGSFILVIFLGLLITLEKVDLSKLFGSVTGVQAGSQDRIHFMNTGVADCIIIESVNTTTNEKEYALVDGGLNYIRNYLYGDNSYFKRVMGDKKFKYMILTHSHDDHATGMYYIASEYADKNTQFYYGYNQQNTSRIEDVKNTIKRWGGTDSNFHYLESQTGAVNTPTRLQLGNFKIELLNSEKDSKTIGGKNPLEDDNRSSIIELVTHIPSGTKTLLTGDMEYDDEYRFLCNSAASSAGECRKYKNESGTTVNGIDYLGKIDILKLGHHGSYTSNSLDFLKKINPDNAVVTRDGKWIWSNVAYNSIDSIMWFVDNNKPIYDTSFDFTGFERVMSGDREYFDQEITDKKKEAIVINFYSGNKNYSIASSGYDVNTAKLNKYFTSNGKDSKYEYVTIKDKYQNNKEIRITLYTPNTTPYWGFNKQTLSGGKYTMLYLYPRNIVAPAGWFTTADGKTYYNNSSGVQMTNFTSKDPVSNSSVTYEVNLCNDVKCGNITKCKGNCSGWLKNYEGKWYFIDKDTGAWKYGFQTIDDIKYYFSPTWDSKYNYGEMYTGWNVIGSNCYYFDNYGALKTGSFSVGGETYTADSEGKVTANNVKIGEYTYQCGNNVAKKIVKRPTAAEYCKKNVVPTGEKQRIVNGEGMGFWWHVDEQYATEGGTYTVHAYLDATSRYVWDNYTTGAVSIQCSISSPTTLKTGAEVNATMKRLAGDTLYTWPNSPEGTNDTNVTSIVKSLVPPEGLAATSSGPPYEIVSTSNSTLPVYMWYKNNTIYYYSEAEKIYMNENSASLFQNFKGLTSIDLSGFDTSRVTNMQAMFMYTTSLTSLDLRNFDTSKVTNMSSMFSNSGLSSINVSSFNTSKVETMDSMFYGLKITSLDLTNFDTSNVWNMSCMFYLDNALVTLDLSSFDTSKVTTMTSMFNSCSSLKTIYVSQLFTLDSVGEHTDVHGADISHMFYMTTSIIGEDGTTYQGDGYAFAHIDGGPENPGYFTGKDIPNLYYIKYDCGTASGEAPATNKLMSGVEYTVALTPGTCTKEGYVFTGWNTKIDGSGYAGWTPGGHWTWNYGNGQYGIENNQVLLYAQWSPADSNTYSITYNCGSGTGTAPADTLVSNGVRILISGNDDACTKEGYVFTGWNTEPDGSGESTWYPRWEGIWEFRNGQYGIENNELHLYAQYSPLGGDTYTLNYSCGTDAYGNPPITLSLKNGDKFIVAPTANTCTKPGYTFVTWKTSEDDNGIIWRPGIGWTWEYSNGEYGIENNLVTLYAQWKVKEGIYLDLLDNTTMKISSNKIIITVPKEEKYETVQQLNSNLDKSTGWKLYDKNGKSLTKKALSNIFGNVAEFLEDEGANNDTDPDDEEDEDAILTTGCYLENEENQERYTIIINGDIDEDGIIGIKDLYQSYLQYKDKDSGLDENQYIAGDYDASGQIDIKDLYSIYLKMKDKD